jgi:hypothetical protein
MSPLAARRRSRPRVGKAPNPTPLFPVQWLCSVVVFGCIADAATGDFFGDSKYDFVVSVLSVFFVQARGAAFHGLRAAFNPWLPVRRCSRA